MNTGIHVAIAGAGASFGVAVDRAHIAELACHLQRRTAWELSVTDRHLFVAVDGTTCSGTVERFTLQPR